MSITNIIILIILTLFLLIFLFYRIKNPANLVPIKTAFKVIKKELEQLNYEESHLLSNIIVEKKDTSVLIPYIYISKKGIIIINISQERGIIYGGSNDDYWTLYFKSTTKGEKIENPYKNTRQGFNIINDHFEKEYKVYLYIVYVDAKINNKINNVINVNELRNKIDSLEDKYNSEDILTMESKLNSIVSKMNYKDFSKILNETNQKIKKKVIE